jgi:hypothetical protein
VKRWIFAVLGGFVIPFLYTIIFGPLTLYIENSNLNQLLGFPVRWPVIILSRLVPFDWFPFRDQDATVLFILIVVCDVMLYTILTYFLLWRFSRPENRQQYPPPTPPGFGNMKMTHQG